jgi:hypothetical protein
MVRMLAPSFISTEDWNKRTPTNRAMMAVQGAAERLEGLRNICLEVSFAEMAKRGPNARDWPASPYSFLALTLGDLAGGLNAAHKLWWDDYNVKSKGTWHERHIPPIRTPRLRPRRDRRRSGSAGTG